MAPINGRAHRVTAICLICLCCLARLPSSASWLGFLAPHLGFLSFANADDKPLGEDNAVRLGKPALNLAG